jgi:hypothetical protein
MIRVTGIGELGTTLATTSNRSTLQRNTLLTRARWRHIPEDGILLRKYSVLETESLFVFN